jgi:hypothetical protein
MTAARRRRRPPSTAQSLAALARIGVGAGRRVADRRRVEPPPVSLGPAPADGFSVEGAQWWEAKREAEERAAFRLAYEAGRTAARRERTDRALDLAERAAGRGRPGRRRARQ